MGGTGGCGCRLSGMTRQFGGRSRHCERRGYSACLGMIWNGRNECKRVWDKCG